MDLWGNVILGLGLLAAAVKFREFAGAETIADKLAIINAAVAAAEQMLGKQPGETRLAWVMEQLQKRFPNIDVTELRMYVESAVYWLHQGGADVPATSEADTAAAIPFWDESRSN